MMQKLAWLLPRKLVYWAYVRAVSTVSCETCRDKQPDEITYSDVATFWGAKC